MRAPFGALAASHAAGPSVDQIAGFEQFGVGLLAHLQRVAAVHENGRLVLQHHRGTGRAGERRQPGQPFVAGRHVFALVLVGMRHHETVEPAALELGAQRGETRRQVAASERSSKTW